MTFDDLRFELNPDLGFGAWAVTAFPNGFGAIVSHSATRPKSLSRYRLTVLREKEGVYDTDRDAFGAKRIHENLTPEDVTDLLAKIEALPAVRQDA